ncbi:saccharopine dehydrogenase NADP-binding domain-containing protein [Glaciihabitans sp. UYNi722]|uniref:saccharopine dehydrogenase NADP-binding domain-containing protein n=1 Tax=Glaciihabitans sp. UYNi722 TaxID=3156344 RepID=UPI003399EE32
MTWAIYGATGYTGGLIAAEAIARGERPVLLGRTESRLRPFAESLDLPFVVVNDASLAKALTPLDLVVNAAGPFVETLEPVLTACIVSGTHYLDISNEFESVQQLFRQGARVRAVGITAVPSVGFGTVVTDAVAAHAVGSVAEPVAVEVAMFADNARGGPATSASVVGVLGSGGVRIVNGLVQRAPLGRGIRRISTPIGARSIVPIATGDLVTVRQTTGMRTVSASVGFSAPATLLTAGLPVVGFAARAHLVKGLPEVRHSSGHVYRSYAWARATDANGHTASSWLSTGEGFAFTATSTVNAVLGVLGRPLADVATIASVLGTEFALGVPDTRIDALDDRGRIVTGS